VTTASVLKIIIIFGIIGGLTEIFLEGRKKARLVMIHLESLVSTMCWTTDSKKEHMDMINDIGRIAYLIGGAKAVKQLEEHIHQEAKKAHKYFESRYKEES
jgi:hypothetical protein